MTDSEQSSDLNNRILSLVGEYWEENERPLLLSRLGNQDNGDIAKCAKQKSGGLAMYLRQELTNHVRVIQHGSRPTIIGVIPTSVKIRDNEIDELLDKTGSQFVNVATRFHPAFWEAFRKPLSASQKRYMSIREPFYFQDAAPENRPDGFVEVAAEYILGPDSDPTEVHRKVRDWLSANQIEEARFFSKAEAKEKRLSSNNLLDKLLLALEPEDLKRISMPLDIVNKLRQQSL